MFRFSFGDISNQTIMGDAGMFAVGFMIVFNYVVFMLGKFNAVEQRVNDYFNIDYDFNLPVYCTNRSFGILSLCCL